MLFSYAIFLCVLYMCFPMLCSDVFSYVFFPMCFPMAFSYFFPMTLPMFFLLCVFPMFFLMLFSYDLLLCSCPMCLSYVYFLCFFPYGNVNRYVYWDNEKNEEDNKEKT